MLRFIYVFSVVALLSWSTSAIQSAANPFEKGWTLQPQNSVLSFQTIKNETKVELSSFLEYDGSISEAGKARVRINMDSVESKVDLRNVRLRFILFETFDHPEGLIELTVPEVALADLTEKRRKRMVLPYVLELAGQRVALESEVIVTLIDYNSISVASAFPISLSMSDFGLLEGIRKLEEAASVDIIPSATVAFNFAFGRNEKLASPEIADLTVASLNTSASPSFSDFSVAECRTRFDAASQTGAIRFASNSANLASDSLPLLASLTVIINRCPGLSIEVGGHTDSTGDATSNQELSEARALSVSNFLAESGVDPERLSVQGFGENRPIADNTTERGRQTNRRIEFSIQTEG